MQILRQYKNKHIFIRTVTFYYTGRLVDAFDNFLVLESVAWIANTGRFSEALETGKFDEIEPYPDGEVFINIGSIVDICLWNHALPRGKK